MTILDSSGGHAAGSEASPIDHTGLATWISALAPSSSQDNELPPSISPSTTLAGRKVPRIGFGTAWPENLGFDEAVTLIREAYQVGVRVIDTADVYGPDGAGAIGFSETAIREAFGGTPPADLVVVSKCGLLRPLQGRICTVNNRADSIRLACESSLQRLGLDTLPLYLLHSLSPAYRIEDVMAHFAQLREEGRTYRTASLTAGSLAD